MNSIIMYRVIKSKCSERPKVFSCLLVDKASQHGNANERGQTLPKQGVMDENTPFNRKCTLEPGDT